MCICAEIIKSNCVQRTESALFLNEPQTQRDVMHEINNKNCLKEIDFTKKMSQCHSLLFKY
jgi:hypothetical protein